MATTDYKVLGQAQATTYPTTVYTVPTFAGTVGAAVISSITMSNTSSADQTVDVYLLDGSISQAHTSVYSSFNYSNGGDGSGPSVMVYANGKFTGIPAESALRAVNSTDGISWQSSGGTAANGPYNDLIYANSTYVAVGDFGKLRTSTDTLTWTTQTSDFGASNINGVTYGNGVYVIGGDGGRLSTSTDAVTWTTRTSTFGTTNIRALAYGNGVYVAAGSSGQIRSSTDAVTWTTRTSGFGTTSISVLAYGNGTFLAAGGQGINKTSTDGITWTARTALPTGTVWSGLGTVTHGVFSGGRFLLSGFGAYFVAMSTNGVTWTYTRPIFSYSPTVMAFENGLLVAGTNSALTASLYALPYKSNALVYGTTIPANSSTTITAGITLPEGFTVQAKASADSSITVHAFGCEIY